VLKTNIDQKHVKMFNSVHLCNCTGSVWSSIAQMRVNASVSSVILSSQYFYLPKFHLVTDSHRKVVCSIFQFI